MSRAEELKKEFWDFHFNALKSSDPQQKNVLIDFYGKYYQFLHVDGQSYGIETKKIYFRS